MDDKIKIIANKAVFPLTASVEQYNYYVDTGITFREYTAAKILAGLVSNPRYTYIEKYLAREAISFTDELIKELAK